MDEDDGAAPVEFRVQRLEAAVPEVDTPALLSTASPSLASWSSAYAASARAPSTSGRGSEAKWPKRPG
jgi:hypothetical protein